jgi:hypothetical protein
VEDIWTVEGGENCNMRSFTDLYSSPSIIRIIESEMGRACSTNWGEEERL